MKKLFLLFAFLSLPSVSYAGSWWNINGNDVYVPNHAKSSMRNAINQANSAGATGMACQTVLCLAPYVGMGSDGGAMCQPAKQIYSNIRVFGFYGFDPDLTMVARGIYLDMCPSSANKATADSENQTVGGMFTVP